ncbi:MAG: STAS domain-containing protein [Chloroflexi bacterium]|nr:STAS domain-containing protein [Chloroflexota bacterium]
MSIRQQQFGKIQLVSVDGRLDQDQTPQLETVLNALLDEGRNVLVVDLTRTNYINSGGLRCLVSVWRKARRQDGNLALCGLNDRLQEVFSMVGFDKVFSIYPDSKTAVKAVK